MRRPPPLPLGSIEVPCVTFRRKRSGGRRSPLRDRLTVEDPIEYRISGRPIATVMRTPGEDLELFLGYLFGEGWISGIADVGSISLCGSGERPRIGNVVDLIPAAGRPIDTERPARAGPVASSCGVCGKRTIAEVLESAPDLSAGARSIGAGAGSSRGRGRQRRRGAPRARLRAETLLRLPRALRDSQRLFESTGSLHAAGLFTLDGSPVTAHEDVGRHNAVDKAIGASLLRGEIPLAERALLVSGRASFEIVQKAHRAGVPIVAAVSGVSSLARDLAQAAGVTLVGFLREASFQIYTHAGRIGG